MKKIYLILLLILLIVIFACYPILQNKNRDIPTLEARLLVIKDNKNLADSLDSVGFLANKDFSYREIYFRYEIGNDSEDTLYFPLASMQELSSKSHISVKVKDLDDVSPQLFFVWKSNSYKIPPHEVIDMSFTVCKIFTVEEEKKKEANIYDLLPKLQMEYKLDSADIQQTDLLVPYIRFNNDTTGIKILLLHE